MIPLFLIRAELVRGGCLSIFVLAFSLVTSGALAQNGRVDHVTTMSIAVQLKRLAADHGITIEGVHLVEQAFVRPVRGTTIRRIQQLLTDYNYVLTQDFDGTIERVVILKKKSGGPQPIILETTRQGNHHVVEATIRGHGSEQLNVSLLVDTGADYVVLPESVMDELNLDRETYELRTIQTANGKVDALFGPLPILQLGPERLIDVDVAFIEDERLDGTKLLGMSVLNRYRMTIDDKLHRITLIKSQ
jgi:aspartyl protease family protein